MHFVEDSPEARGLIRPQYRGWRNRVTRLYRAMHKLWSPARSSVRPIFADRPMVINCDGRCNALGRPGCPGSDGCRRSDAGPNSPMPRLALIDQRLIAYRRPFAPRTSDSLT